VAWQAIELEEAVLSHPIAAISLIPVPLCSICHAQRSLSLCLPFHYDDERRRAA
jgi:hypothetical protein